MTTVDLPDDVDELLAHVRADYDGAIDDATAIKKALLLWRELNNPREMIAEFEADGTRDRD